jgi:hypothetical protein
MEDKILKIAKERYRGWRSTLHSTYKAYNTDAARMANVPEDLQPEEWEWLINYFSTNSKFQVFSKFIVCVVCSLLKLSISHKRVYPVLKAPIDLFFLCIVRCTLLKLSTSHRFIFSMHC